MIQYNHLWSLLSNLISTQFHFPAGEASISKGMTKKMIIYPSWVTFHGLVSQARYSSYPITITSVLSSLVAALSALAKVSKQLRAFHNLELKCGVTVELFGKWTLRNCVPFCIKIPPIWSMIPLKCSQEHLLLSHTKKCQWTTLMKVHLQGDCI